MAWYIVNKINGRFYLEIFVNLLITDKKTKLSFECFSQLLLTALLLHTY